MNVRRANIISWLNQEEYQEKRGWKKDKARKYTDKSISENICKIKKERVEDKRYFVGSPHIQMDYENQFPKTIVPKTWYIDKVIREAGLQTKKPKRKKRGGSKYLLYPIQCIRNLGYVQQSADFIGKKYILGRSDLLFRVNIKFILNFLKSLDIYLPAELEGYQILDTIILPFFIYFKQANKTNIKIVIYK